LFGDIQKAKQLFEKIKYFSIFTITVCKQQLIGEHDDLSEAASLFVTV